MVNFELKFDLKVMSSFKTTQKVEVTHLNVLCVNSMFQVRALVASYDVTRKGPSLKVTLGNTLGNRITGSSNSDAKIAYAIWHCVRPYARIA